MLPELGLLCLIGALCACALQMIAVFNNEKIVARLSLTQVLFTVASYLALTYSFLVNDFSVRYVAHTSNSSLPFYYKITAVWGAHEGSLLLWVLILNVWIFAMWLAAKKWRADFANCALTIMGAINFALIFLIIKSSNPFTRYMLNPPLDGADLNPMLQDFAMIIHPPILYIGYVGTAAAFALTIAGLLVNRIDAVWAQLVRPWVLTAWLFLTVGITLGSWWAYYELGWGGWWFWDPVENASFMPWLTATALLHSLALSAKKGKLLSLVVFLAIITFVLSIFGTFLVRSGSVSSVHAFASDPERGMYILQFLLIIIGGAVVLHAIRFRDLKNPSTLTKQDLGILSNNVLLLVATCTVLLGTVYPMIYEYFTSVKISVGYPYFNAVFLPIMLLLFVIMISTFVYSKTTLIYAIIAAVASAGVLYLCFGSIKPYAVVGLSFALLITYSALRRPQLAMSLAHIGLAVTIAGISITPNYEVEMDVQVKVGDSVQIENHNLVFDSIKAIDGPNYIGYQGAISIDNRKPLFPEKRLYLAQELVMTETAILPGVFKDFYVALGQQISPDQWSMRLYYKPLVRWIWFGAILMAFGALCALFKMQKRKLAVD